MMVVMKKIYFLILFLASVISSSVCAENSLNSFAEKISNFLSEYSLDAMNTRGVDYIKGRGVARNYAEAVKWFRKAAERGLVEAQYNLGLVYHHQGAGVTQNDVEAVKWFRKAAEQGYPRA